MAFDTKDVFWNPCDAKDLSRKTKYQIEITWLVCGPRPANYCNSDHAPVCPFWLGDCRRVHKICPSSCVRPKNCKVRPCEPDAEFCKSHHNAVRHKGLKACEGASWRNQCKTLCKLYGCGNPYHNALSLLDTNVSA